jgi:hypothetical protein
MVFRQSAWIWKPFSQNGSSAFRENEPTFPACEHLVEERISSLVFSETEISAPNSNRPSWQNPLVLE